MSKKAQTTNPKSKKKPEPIQRTVVRDPVTHRILHRPNPVR